LDILSAGAFVAGLVLSLLSIWLTLDWKVRRTRAAFEKELTRQGMTKEDARRISYNFRRLKDNIMSTIRGSLFRRD